MDADHARNVQWCPRLCTSVSWKGSMMSRTMGRSAGIVGAFVLIAALVLLQIGRTPHVTASSGGTWTTAAPLPGPRDFPAATAGLSGNIYVFGGNDSGVDYNTTFIYHP